MNNSFLQAVPLLEKLEGAGFEAYFVGGSVRDYLLNIESNDIDIATSAQPDEVQSLFHSVIPVGIEHGTVIVRNEGISYEVTTFREEGAYLDYRHPSSVKFVRSLDRDLARRDFTMNAIAMTKTGEIRDPFNGQQDLFNGIIRTVGDPVQRFREDPLRMLRALRFMAVMGYRFEQETKEAICSMVHFIKHLSMERVASEWSKLLSGKEAAKSLAVMEKSGFFNVLPFPKSAPVHKLEHVDWNALQTVSERWAAICLALQVDEPARLLKKWKVPNRDQMKTMAILDACHCTVWGPWELYLATCDIAISSVKVRYAVSGLSSEKETAQLLADCKRLPILSRSELPVKTGEIITLIKRSPGEWVGRLLLEIEKEIVMGSLPLNPHDIMEWAKRWEEK